ncbi:hypothetical protein CP985_03500 [Malaciobacter mytili LMG 24559]|uniref:Uncharacterized protein n=1 Tax=Malaciobacter mytili LMG 24559 TaxID=1032238 RepID=A0AAX2AIN9_9BACT|nr:hypothetical protein [Malaciobacter mytili]AXH16424.1 hypothetical protein AMYT_a0126 [Malaciobacter mytili LMG 24559]RXK16490.1 hypothetical protein CP985_03500 [Malaciobacter mytili LMG 24559]
MGTNEAKSINLINIELNNIKKIFIKGFGIDFPIDLNIVNSIHKDEENYYITRKDKTITTWNTKRLIIEYNE